MREQRQLGFDFEPWTHRGVKGGYFTLCARECDGACSWFGPDFAFYSPCEGCPGLSDVQKAARDRQRRAISGETA